jgi:hypothetical protein
VNLSQDIKSERLLYWKGALFLLLALIAGGALIALNPNWTNLVLLLITVWAACRFYYFLFYVIEKYADPQFRYAGILSFIRYRQQKGSRPEGRNP